MKIDRVKVLFKYNCRCAYCGKKLALNSMQVDHRYPKRFGGTDAFDNLMPSCRRCNHYKRANSIEVYRNLINTVYDRIGKTYLAKVAEDYGIIKPIKWHGKFFFELYDESVNMTYFKLKDQ